MADPVASTTDKGGFVLTVPSGSKGVWVQIKGNTIVDPGVGTIKALASASTTDTGTDERCGGLWYAGTGERALPQLTYEFEVDNPAVSYDVIVGYGADFGRLQISSHTFEAIQLSGCSSTQFGCCEGTQEPAEDAESTNCDPVVINDTLFGATVADVFGSSRDNNGDTIAAEYVNVQQLNDHTSQVMDVAFSPTDAVMVTVFDDGTVIIYDTSVPGNYIQVATAERPYESCPGSYLFAIR